MGIALRIMIQKANAIIREFSGAYNLHRAAVRQALRWIDDDSFSGGHPGADRHFIIETAADGHGAALGAAILHD